MHCFVYRSERKSDTYVYLRERDALDRFYKRGVRSGLMEPIPIRLIVSESAPLMGVVHLWMDEQAQSASANAKASALLKWYLMEYASLKCVLRKLCKTR